MSRKRLPNETILAMLTCLFDEGLTCTQTAVKVFGKKTKESTVRRYKKDYLKDGHCFGVTLNEQGHEEEVSSEEDDWKLPEDTLEELTKHPEWEVSNLAKRLRHGQRANNQLRKIQREVFDCDGVKPKTLPDILQEILPSVNEAPKVVMKSSCESDSNMIAEVLLSDVQWGKLMHGYNTEVATARVREYIKRVIEDIRDKERNGVFFDKIILALLGDIIESDKKHANSGRACDTGTAEQLKTATEVLFNDVIEPLANLGYKLDVVSITGNHDHDGHGLNMYLPGSQHLSWPMYHTLKMLTKAKGYKHVTHEIPEGAYLVKDIYGFNTLYEHGVGVSTSEAALMKRITERGNQVRKHMSYIRIGDKHNVSRFNLDTKVVNGATFGRCDDKGGGEYSSIAGYAAEPAQLTIYHTPRDSEDTRLSICDSLLVQLGHITKESLHG